MSKPDLSYLGEYRGLPGLNLGHHYANAPIEQALVEFHLQPGLGVTLDRLSELNFGDDYGPPELISDFEDVVDPESGEPEPEEYEAGFSFAQASGDRRVHATADRFTFIARGRYEGWESFIAEVEDAWLIYRQVTEPVAIVMIGVRYTNYIPLPHQAVEIKDYLRTSIEISSYLPQAIESMFMQVEIPLDEHAAKAVITSALMPAIERYPEGSVLLDIDVKSDVRIDTHAEDFNDVLPATLDKLRLAKNFVFEACITDATRGLIDDGG